MQALFQQLSERLHFTQEILIGALILARTMPMVMLTPYLGGKLIPPEIKMGLGLMLAIVLWPLAHTTMTGEIPTTPLGFLLLMMKETFIGLALGFANSLVFYAVEMAGRLIDTVCMTSMSEVLVPESGERSTMFGDLLYQLLIVMFVVIGGHRIMLEAFVYSFATLPLDKSFVLGAGMQPFADFVISTTGHILVVAVLIAAPVAAATFLTDVVFAILNRVAPQLNAYFMSMSVKTMMRAVIVLIALDPLLRRLEHFVGWSLQAFDKMLGLLAGK